MINNFLNDLNDSQREAALYNDSPQLIIAGAGSGKTRVLTYKIAYLLTQGYKPWNIMALTFTNKAAREMKERIGSLVDSKTAQYLNMGTFHSLFSRILRIEAHLIGYESNFTIYDENDSRSLIKTIIKEMGLDDKTYKSAVVLSRISMAKNKLIMPNDYAITSSLIERDKETDMPAVASIYSAYCERCKIANAMDFDDLLTNTYMLFASNDDVRRKYADKFKYILVDEYQDTNTVQQNIVLQLTKEHKHICAVGDDAQSIYAFRGANIDNILDFQKQFGEDTRLFKLEQNYRSTKTIVKAANSLIIHNIRQIKKDIFSHNIEGEKIIIKPTYSDKEEAIIVCNEIKKIIKSEKCEYNDFAILYRTNSQSRNFEEAMRKVSIPYKIYGGLGFYQRKEIKDIIAYFRMVVNPNDEEAFKRIINYPKRGIGNSSVAKIAEIALNNKITFWNVIGSLNQYNIGLSNAAIAKITAFYNMINGFKERCANTDAYTLGVDIIKSSGISADIYADKSPENISRQENLEEFLTGIRDFVENRKEEGLENEVSISDFLKEVSLLSDVESDENDEDGKVSLMTIHSAKGLEFPTVFIVGMEENIFPSIKSLNSKRSLEEERRLFYVAITRAEKHCIITYTKNRYCYGKLEQEIPSRFISEIAPELVYKDDTTDIFMRSKSNAYRPYSNVNIISRDNKRQNNNTITSAFEVAPKSRDALHHNTAQTNNLYPKSHLQKLSNVVKDNKYQSIDKKSTTQQVIQNIEENSIIEHERFGIGRIIRLEGYGENQKATVEFKNAGIKQLLLKFARFKVIK